VFAARLVPVRLFDDVERFYFRRRRDAGLPTRSLWGLHNAFTRAMKDLSPVRGFRANVALGNAFGIKADGGEIIDTTADRGQLATPGAGIPPAPFFNERE